MTSANASEEEPQIAEESGVSEVVEVQETDDSETSEGEAQSVIPGVCEFYQRLDNLHISSSSPPTLSVHGGWTNIDCNATHASVTVKLQRQNSLGIYTDVGSTGQQTVRSAPPRGLPTSARATARYQCQGTASRTYRGWTDVDVIGVADPPNTTTTSGYTFNCG